MSIKISEHFSLGEFACKCCGTIKYNPRMALLLEDLEALREVTMRPVVVVSGYRCPKNNQRVGGAVDSKHLHAIAADLHVEGFTPAELAETVKLVCKNVKGIGVGATKFHVDVREGPLAQWKY